MREVLQYSFFQNQVADYLVFVGLVIAGAIVIQVFRSLVLRRLRERARDTETPLDDFIVRIIGKVVIPLLYLVLLYLASQHLAMPPALTRGIRVLVLVIVTIMGVHFFIAAIDFAIRDYWVKKSDDPNREKNLRGILPAVKVVVWLLGIVFLLDNLGFKISTVVAGLGIGGIAVAMAAQAVLRDLFSYFAILFDRPFEEGDFVIVGEFMGTIEHVGIKTTRLRSLGGEQLVFSNSDLTDSRLRNYKRMEKRRVLFQLGVTYQTSPGQMKEIPEIVKKIVAGIEEAELERVHFSAYGDFSLIFEIVYYVKSGLYVIYMDIQQRINLAIMEEFQKRGIEFAYPTQTLFLNKTDVQE